MKLKDLHENNEPGKFIKARGMQWRRFPDSGKWFRWGDDVKLDLASATSNRDVLKASLNSTQFKKLVEIGYDKGKIITLEEKPEGSVFMCLKVGRKEVALTINKHGRIVQE